MEKVYELIDAMIAYMEATSAINHQDTFSYNEIVSIVVAVLSLLGVIYVAVYTVRTNTKSQNANARVEWIQKVRDTTAELISSYYSALNANDNNEIQKEIINAREKVERLILYFGPENKTLTKDICDKKTNSGKNDLILEFLTALSNDFVQYNINAQKGILSQAKKRTERAYQNMTDNVIKTEYGEVETDEGVESYTDFTFEPEAEREYEEEQRSLDKIIAFNDSLDKRLIMLRDIMRIYLKLEWNKAKKGK